jgi:hypothetical protein
LPSLSRPFGDTRSREARSRLAAGYRFYFAVFVREVSRFTPLFMAAIVPFRKLIVYPALLRKITE